MLTAPPPPFPRSEGVATRQPATEENPPRPGAPLPHGNPRPSPEEDSAPDTDDLEAARPAQQATRARGQRSDDNTDNMSRSAPSIPAPWGSRRGRQATAIYSDSHRRAARSRSPVDTPVNSARASPQETSRSRSPTTRQTDPTDSGLASREDRRAPASSSTFGDPRDRQQYRSRPETDTSSSSELGSRRWERPRVYRDGRVPGRGGSGLPRHVPQWQRPERRAERPAPAPRGVPLRHALPPSPPDEGPAPGFWTGSPPDNIYDPNYDWQENLNPNAPRQPHGAGLPPRRAPAPAPLGPRQRQAGPSRQFMNFPQQPQPATRMPLRAPEPEAPRHGPLVDIGATVSNGATPIQMLRGDQFRGSNTTREVIQQVLKKTFTPHHTKMMAFSRKICLAAGVEPMLQHPVGGVAYSELFEKHAAAEDDLTSETHIAHNEGRQPATSVALPGYIVRMLFDILFAWAAFATQFTQISVTSWAIVCSDELDHLLQHEHDFCNEFASTTPLTTTAARLATFAARMAFEVSRIVEDTRLEQTAMLQARLQLPRLDLVMSVPLAGERRLRTSSARFGIRPYQGMPERLIPPQAHHLPSVADLRIAHQANYPRPEAGAPAGDPGSRAFARFQPNRPPPAADVHPEARAHTARVEALRRLSAMPSNRDEQINMIANLCCLKFFTRGCNHPYCQRAHVSREDAERLGIQADLFDAAAAQINDRRRGRDRQREQPRD